MANWLYVLDLKDFWEKSDEIGVQEVAKRTANKLLKLIEQMKSNTKIKPFIEELEDIQFEMQELGKIKDLDYEDFNIVFEQLYDMADTCVSKKGFYNDEKLMWIKTCF